MCLVKRTGEVNPGMYFVHIVHIMHIVHIVHTVQILKFLQKADLVIEAFHPQLLIVVQGQIRPKSKFFYLSNLFFKSLQYVSIVRGGN